MSGGSAASAGPAAGQLSFLDRFLAVRILAAMAVGLGLGRLVPGLGDTLAKVRVAAKPPPSSSL